MAGSNVLVFKTPDGSKSDLPMSVDEETSIGRHPDCTLTVSQPSVSRRHARLWFDGGEWHVEDLQSSNGTYVNNRRISKSTISEGDEVRCGDFVLTYVVREAPREASPAKAAPPSLPPSPPAPPPRVVGKLSTAGDMPPPPPAIADRATVGLDQDEDAPSTVALLELESQRNDLIQELKSLKAQAEEAQKESDQKEREIEDLRGNVDALEDELSGLKAELASVRSQVENSQNHADEELNTAREELETVRDELDALRQTNVQLRSDLEAAETKAQASDGDEQIRVLEAELANAEQSRASAEQDRDSIENELKEAQSALAAAQEAAENTASASTGSHAELSGDLDAVSAELRDQIMLTGRLLAELAPLVDAAEKIRAEELPGKLSTAITQLVEESDGAQTMDAAQNAISQTERLVRSLRRMARELRESN